MDRTPSFLLMLFGIVFAVLYFHVVRHPFLGFAALVLLLLPLGAEAIGKVLAGNTR